MVALAINTFQDETRRASELGIRLEHVDGEGNLIHDALTGTVTARKEFEVAEGVVPAIAVNVMDGFLAQQFAPEVLFHDEAVLEDGFFAAGNPGRDGDTPVPVARPMARKALAAGELGGELRNSVIALVCRFANGVAELLLPVVDRAPRPNVADHGLNFPTLVASESAFRRSLRVTTSVGAISGAVFRVFSVPLSVGPQQSRLHREDAPAVGAGEVDRVYQRCRPPVLALVLQNARLGAEPAARFAGLARKWAAAIFADFLNRHDTLLVGYKGSVAGVVT